MSLAGLSARQIETVEKARNLFTIAWRCRLIYLPAGCGVTFSACRDGTTSEALVEIIPMTAAEWNAPGSHFLVPADAWKDGMRLSRDVKVPFVVAPLEGDIPRFMRIDQPRMGYSAVEGRMLPKAACHLLQWRKRDQRKAS